MPTMKVEIRIEDILKQWKREDIKELIRQLIKKKPYALVDLKNLLKEFLYKFMFYKNQEQEE